jgi:hypothetical protein
MLNDSLMVVEERINRPVAKYAVAVSQRPSADDEWAISTVVVDAISEQDAVKRAVKRVDAHQVRVVRVRMLVM